MKKLKQFLKGLKEGQKKFGENLAIIINTLILSVAYFIGIGISSIFAKIFGKQFLDIKIDKKAKTYWTKLNLTKKSKKEYYRQF